MSFVFGNVVCQLVSAIPTGSGIESRYASVQTFNTTVKNKSIFEIAGWQWSGLDQLLFHQIWIQEHENYLLPGSG